MNPKQKKRKIGRNEPCPCGSNKKFKYCHGSITAQEEAQAQTKSFLNEALAHQEAMALQRTQQQGQGKPIISAESQGTRFVAIKSRFFHSKKWRTFLDFLGDYVKITIGSDWGNNEIKTKSIEQRHPILVWYNKICALQRRHIKKIGQVSQLPMTGATQAYYGLAYDLYCLDHNAILQERLIDRIKNNNNNFYGARYEIIVAAILIRAGFEIEFEDESLRNSSHCEFTATSRNTGKSFSVECKHRESGKGNGEIKLSKLGRTLRSALSKQAKHMRIVFIELNFPYDPKKYTTFPPTMDLAMNHIRKFENNKTNGAKLPPAFIFLTNFPFHHHLDDKNIGRAVLSDGFKIPEYKTDSPYSLHDAIIYREKYKDIHCLLKSIEDYSVIPSTFDGEIPEFAFGDATQRLIVGRHYLVKDSKGNDRVGLMTSATMNEPECKAYCCMKLETGEHIITTWPLSKVEMSAYRAHPNTFFGRVEENHKANSPLELYDFFLESYSKLSKEKLLERMAAAPDINFLKTLSQSELASVYAERCTSSAFSQRKTSV